MIVDRITPTTVMVQFERAEDAPGIDRYYGKTKNESVVIECEIEADVEPLECELEGLTPAMKHIVVGYACLLGSLGCSEGIEESFWTPPMGKTVLLFFDYKLKI